MKVGSDTQWKCISSRQKRLIKKCGFPSCDDSGITCRGSTRWRDCKMPQYDESFLDSPIFRRRTRSYTLQKQFMPKSRSFHITATPLLLAVTNHARTLSGSLSTCNLKGNQQIQVKDVRSCPKAGIHKNAVKWRFAGSVLFYEPARTKDRAANLVLMSSGTIVFLLPMNGCFLRRVGLLSFTGDNCDVTFKGGRSGFRLSVYWETTEEILQCSG